MQAQQSGRRLSRRAFVGGVGGIGEGRPDWQCWAAAT
jgi:hypothetical protein